MQIKFDWTSSKELEAYLDDLENKGTKWHGAKMRMDDCRQIQNAFGPLEDLLDELKRKGA